MSSSERAAAWQEGFGKIPGPPPRSRTRQKSTPVEEELESTAAGTALRAVDPPVEVSSPEPAEVAPPPETKSTAVRRATTPDSRAAGRQQAKGASRSMRTASASAARAQRSSQDLVQLVQDTLEQLQVPITDVTADVTPGSKVHLAITCDDVPALEANLDVLADALSVNDLEASVVGDVVHMWVKQGARSSRRQAGVWVTLPVREAVDLEHEATQATYTTIVLTAFNRQAGPDGSGLRALFPDVEPAVAGPMAVPTRKRRQDLGAAVQLWLYLDKEQEAVLDAAVGDTGAGSRSALVTALLAADLGVEERPRPGE